MSKVGEIKKLSNTPYLNFYEFEAVYRDGRTAPYYVSSRAKKTEDLKAVHHENRADGVILYGIYGEKINLRKSLIGEAVLCIVCYLAATLSPWPIVSLIGCALCGLSVALMWPGMLSLTAARHPEGGTAMFGILAVFGDVGCSLGPWLTGLVSTAVMAGRTGQAVEQAGLKAGLMAAILFPVLMIVGLLTMKEKKN